ncbi:hypothetical protein EZV62_000168 [Acer yangbiense]|uniref:F-box domain-containing protein n=1 Tax=Acer yangbiense TaxID=1000413 RepID=A0A5C7IR88_9ROSI|nr:hypothetical protein EZV62_000168 [Acer yangbiense]
MKKDTHVPDVLIFNILRSLPAKSLVRFKCVCKSWLSFISQLRYDNEEFILRTSYCFCSIDFKASDEIKLVMLGYPLRYSTDLTVIGSCNGLLCIRNSGDILCIWNPWTRRYKTVSSEPNRVTILSRVTSLSGFGYDHSTDDYIIVRFTNIVEIYSRKTDSWFQMGRLPQQIWHSSLKKIGFFVNGALYWHVDDGCLQTILCFDLVDRKFSMIVIPDDHDKKPDFDLGVLGGRLCMINYYHDCHSDIWAWEGNNNKEGSSNWIKLMSIPSYSKDWSIPSNHNKYFAPVFLMKNGEVVLRILHQYHIMNSNRRRSRRYVTSYEKGEKNLFIYNQKNKTLRELTIPYNVFLSHEEITYTRSLVSPASDAGDHESFEKNLLCRDLSDVEKADVDKAIHERTLDLQQHSIMTTGEHKQVRPEICGHLLSEFGPPCKSSSQVSLQWTIELDPM